MAFCFGNCYTPGFGWCGCNNNNGARSGCGCCNFNCGCGGCGCNQNTGAYGSFYASGTATLASGGTFPLANTAAANGVTLNSSTGVVTLPGTGTYKVDWGTLGTTTATTDTTALYLSGTEVAGTRRTVASGTMTGGSTIITATAGDTLSIRLTAAEPVSFSDTNGGITGYLTVEKIS